MADLRTHQIVRKDSRDCFVESLSDAFEIGKIHFVFTKYDLTRPAGERQTDKVDIYIAADEYLNLCRRLNRGELKRKMVEKKKEKDYGPLYECLGGTSAEKLAARGTAREDGKSFSRTAKIVVGDKVDIRFIADSGPGEVTEKGLIVPKFGGKPENHIAVNMSFDTLAELLLATEAHYKAWLTAWYARQTSRGDA